MKIDLFRQKQRHILDITIMPVVHFIYTITLTFYYQNKHDVHMSYDKKLQTAFRFLLPITMKAQIEELEIELGHNQSTIVRIAISEFYQKNCKAKYGYNGSVIGKLREDKTSSKNSVDESIDHLKSLSAPELTEHLKAIGYFEPDKDNGSYTSKSIIIDVLGDKCFHQVQVDNLSGDYCYKRFVFTFDELIKDLKKEKKI